MVEVHVAPGGIYVSHVLSGAIPSLCTLPVWRTSWLSQQAILKVCSIQWVGPACAGHQEQLQSMRMRLAISIISPPPPSDTHHNFKSSLFTVPLFLQLKNPTVARHLKFRITHGFDHFVSVHSISVSGTRVQQMLIFFYTRNGNHVSYTPLYSCIHSGQLNLEALFPGLYHFRVCVRLGHN